MPAVQEVMSSLIASVGNFILVQEQLISGLTNSIRPLSVHEPRGAISLAYPAQQLSPEINVVLVVGLEVFTQYGVIRH